MNCTHLDGDGCKRAVDEESKGYGYCSEHLREWRARWRSGALRAAGVPPVCLAAVDAKAVMGALPQRVSPWVVLLGPTGTGKTWDACLYLLAEILATETAARSVPPDGAGSWEYADKRREAEGRGAGRFLDWPEFLERRKGAMRNDQQDDPMAEAIKARFLVLDDLGAERPTEYALDSASYLLSARYNALAPTIITTNLSVPSLVERYGARVVSRMRQNAEFVMKEGADRRVRT